MLSRPITLLVFNAGLQVLVASLLGFVMLVPMQGFGKALRPKLDAKSLLATHLDWLMLAFMQWGAAFTMAHFALSSLPVAWLLVFGGWTNAVPYLVRGFGINAFVLAGPPKRFVWSAISGISSTAIVIAWAMLLAQAWGKST